MRWERFTIRDRHWHCENKENITKWFPFSTFPQILKKSCIEILAAEPSSICAGGKARNIYLPFILIRSLQGQYNECQHTESLMVQDDLTIYAIIISLFAFFRCIMWHHLSQVFLWHILSLWYWLQRSFNNKRTGWQFKLCDNKISYWRHFKAVTTVTGHNIFW